MDDVYSTRGSTSMGVVGLIVVTYVVVVITWILIIGFTDGWDQIGPNIGKILGYSIAWTFMLLAGGFILIVGGLKLMDLVKG